jgi:hypothetical protein
MRGKGINYDTGFCPGGESSREQFDASVVRGEMRVIARDLHCTAVRISGGDPARLSTAGELAAAEGLEVWFAPFPCELDPGQLAPLFADCAERAEQLRRSGANVVLVTGCELTLFGAGFLPGGTVYERIQRLQNGGEQLYAAFAALPGKLNSFLAETAEAARSRFAGPLTYASGMWEPVDWDPFDIAATDAYRDSGNAGAFRSELRKHRRPGKPLAVTEFGCCGYAGAADRGGLGWAIIDDSTDPPRLDGDDLRDEAEQVRYLEELGCNLRRGGGGSRVLVHLRRLPPRARPRPATRPRHGQLWSGAGAARWPRYRLRRPRLGTEAGIQRTGQGGLADRTGRGLSAPASASVTPRDRSGLYRERPDRW